MANGQGLPRSLPSCSVAITPAESLTKQIFSLERPHPALWTYYIIRAVLTGPGLLAALPYLYFRFHTLRYRFDEEGIHMRVGILFRREVNLTYARIQDIHLSSNLIQRWLGLANVQIQTASGSSGAEMVIEGFKEFEAIRDFLYTRMRGYKPTASSSAEMDEPVAALGVVGTTSTTEVTLLLLGIRDELRRTRELLERGGVSSASGSSSTSASASAPPPGR